MRTPFPTALDLFLYSTVVDVLSNSKFRPMLQWPSLTLVELRRLVDQMPFNQLLGIRVARLHSDGITIVCKLREELSNSAGVLHGGVAATMADAAVGIALSRHFGGRKPATTVELKINYLRPISEGQAIARARLLRIGASAVFVRVEMKMAAVYQFSKHVETQKREHYSNAHFEPAFGDHTEQD